MQTEPDYSIMKVSIEEPPEKKKQRKVLFLLFLTIVIGFVIFVSRGPHISTALKNLILPELEAALQQKVIAKKIYINIFPLFIEARDINVFDENGARLLLAKRVRGYIEPFELLQKNISIRRLVIKEPDLSSDRKHLTKVIDSVNAYLEKESRFPFKVRIKVIEVTRGSVFFQDEEAKISLGVKGLRSEVILSKNTKLNISIGQIAVKKRGLPELTGDITTSLLLRQNEIELKNFTIGSYGSKFQAAGFYSNGKGTLKTELALLVDSLKRILNLKQTGEGKISAEGKIQIENLGHHDSALNQWEDIFIDLKLKGDFYIQTLMEVLKVKEKVEGLINFQGTMKGRLSDISAEGKAKLQNGNLFGVEINSLRCDIAYKEGSLRFIKGDAELYHGQAKAEASLRLPAVESFTLNVKFESVDSKNALMLIGWDPGIPSGKVKGELMTSGSSFNPDGWFIYEASNREQSALGGTKIKGYQASTENILDRVKQIKGAYSLRGDLLSLSNLQIRTPLSDLVAEGTVDITKKPIDLSCRLNTRDVSDLALPYYAGLKGQGTFSGKITGTSDNPEVSGRAHLSSFFLEGYKISDAISSFSYNKKLLIVQELLLTSQGEKHSMKGRISFPEAEKLFDFSKPIYELSASIQNADLGEVVHLFSKDIHAQGKVNADCKIGGKDNIQIDGNAFITKAAVNKISIDSASMSFSYLNKELAFKKVLIKHDNSALKAEGRISSDDSFSFKASSDKILIKDFGLSYVPEGASISIQSEGQGTLKNPDIALTIRVVGGDFNGRSVGDGIIAGEIKNKNISVTASLFDERVKLKGEGYLDDTLPWKAKIEISPGTYDFILGSFLKEMPEDLLLNLKGNVEMVGDRRTIRASAYISQLTLSFRGYSFSNDSDIRVETDNRKLSFAPFAIRSSGTSFVKVSGGMEIGREYNFHVEGKSSISPLTVLSKRIEHLAGEADFAFSIKGKWENPDFKGDLNITNASLGIVGNYPRISAINGHAYIDENKLVVDNISGKIGGGKIEVSGLLHLKAFSIATFYLESTLDNITNSPSKDFTINFKGALLYKGTPDIQSISGDIKINSAKYKETVDWKKWIFIAKTKEVPKTELSALERADLNIKISGDENIYVDNNIARAPVSIDLVARGTILHPILFGTLESKEGIAYFSNNEFRIIHASAYFADPNRLNPVIALSAETSLQGYRIRLNLDGQIEHFNLSLSSDPPLEEMDIIALLTVGKPGTQMAGPGGGISAKEASSFLAGQLQGVYEERLKMITGFERVQVGTYVSKVTGNVEPEITVSKRLLSDKLYVTYSTALGTAATEQQIIRLEYLLDKNISLVGSRDERGITGGDIKFRFEFKRKGK